MKEIKMEIPENTYTLSNEDIAVIHALCFYSPEGMSKKADKVRDKIQKKFCMHNAIGSIKVWNDD